VSSVLLSDVLVNTGSEDAAMKLKKSFPVLAIFVGGGEYGSAL
jgi:hypothetical protein